MGRDEGFNGGMKSLSPRCSLLPLLSYGHHWEHGLSKTSYSIWTYLAFYQERREGWHPYTTFLLWNHNLHMSYRNLWYLPHHLQICQIWLHWRFPAKNNLVCCSERKKITCWGGCSLPPALKIGSLCNKNSPLLFKTFQTSHLPSPWFWIVAMFQTGPSN